MRATVKIFNKKWPRFRIVRRIHMQNKGQRVRSLLVDVHFEGRIVTKESQAINGLQLQWFTHPFFDKTRQLLGNLRHEIVSPDNPRLGRACVKNT